ncbi:DMT family transporter [Hydrogenophaga sp. IBVHS1]|uniref:DMT family transporter n=1 Tax=unclassified Hydrogenophaga TaxID=2610897 RepID=UPI000A2E5395|nr:DMT family transporter [Hydrogenophaga sp. IBVHS1]OSZ74848.1 EamA family transporter [Hydrogenophaga sp. IBVHS1]
MNPSSTISLNSIEAASARERSGMWLMVAGGLMLGTLGVFLEEAGQSPITAVWFRCAFGLLALTAWFAATRRWGELRLVGAARLAAVSAGVLAVVNWLLFFEAIERTSISVATVVVHVQPFLVMAFGAWWWKERITRAQAVAALASLIGLALASGWVDGALTGVGWSSSYLWGVALALLNSVGYAALTLIANRARGVSPLALAWWQCAVGAVVLLWWPFMQGWPPAGPAWAWLAGLGVIHTGLAYVVLYAGVARLTAGRVAVLQFVYPASAVAVDWLVYDRALSPSQLLGVLVMLVALVVVGMQRARQA